MHSFVLPDLAPPGLTIWQIDLRNDPTTHTDASTWKILSPAEKSQAEEYLQQKDRVRFIKTHAALRVLLGEYLNCSPEQIAFEVGAHGKPYVSPQSGIVFNLSHADDFALIAISKDGAVAEVGVDIEFCDPTLNFHELADFVLTPAECQNVLGSAQPRETFFKHWVGKEAVLKALGVGIGEHLQHVTVFPKEDGNYDVQLADVKLKDLQRKDFTCFACELTAPKDHVAAMAWLV